MFFFRNGFEMLVNCWVRTHTEIPMCLALKVSFTRWLKRPFTSFDAAQSSKINSVFVPSKKTLEKKEPGVDFILSFCGQKSRADQNNVVELPPEGPAKLVDKVFRFA